MQCVNCTQQATDWRERERKTGVGSERKIEKGEKTDTSKVHTNVHSRGNDGDEQEATNCDEYNLRILNMYSNIR